MRHLLRVHTANCFTKCGINQMGIFLETIAVHHIINSRNGRAFINPIQLQKTLELVPKAC